MGHPPDAHRDDDLHRRIEHAEAPQAILLLLGSSVKASLIIFFYMHLKLENRNLILIVIIGIFVTSVLMFLVPAYDGTNILQHRYFR